MLTRRWMSRGPLLVALAALAAMPAARADEPRFEQVGHITAPNPASKLTGSITEQLNPCGVGHPELGDLTGLDGWWIELPAWAPDSEATLTFDALDMDVWFYDEECTLVASDADSRAGGMATTPAVEDGTVVRRERGSIPTAARYAVVNLAAGAYDEPFSFRIP